MRLCGVWIGERTDMDLADILELYDHDERRTANAPGLRREVDGDIVRQVMEAEQLGLSFVIYSDLTASNADEAIARQVGYFRRLGRNFEWKYFAHDRPPDLAARLSAHGLSGEEEEPILVLELEQAPSRLLAPVTADVRRVSDADGLESVRRLLSEVWGESFDWFLPRMQRLMQAGTYVSIYLAYVDDLPACAGWIFFPRGSRFAGLWGGSTLPQFRGRGLYTALLAARAQEALARGYQFLTIDASDMSRPIVEKHGFRLLVMTTPFTMQFA